VTKLSNDCNKPNDSVVEYGLTLATIMKNTITISLSSASYVSWQRGAACVCCCAPFCGAAAAERRAAAIDRRLLPAGPTAANPRSNVRRPHDGTDGRTDRQTDGRMPSRYTDPPAPHTVRTVPLRTTTTRLLSNVGVRRHAKQVYWHN